MGPDPDRRRAAAPRTEGAPSPQEGAPSTRRAVAIPASAVRRERVEWLAPGLIPFGVVTLLVGDPGLGKSLYTCWLASRLSRGEFGEPASGLMVTAEDSLSHTVRPRLEAAGADLERIAFVQMSSGGLEDGLRLPDDVAELDRLVADQGARLVVIDPLMAHLPESVNSWRDQSVRLALAPLHALAEKNGCSVLVVAHLNKGLSADPIRRTGGSIGITAAVRSALLLARDPDDPDGEEGRRRVLAHFKCNVAPPAESLTYEVRAVLLPASADGPQVETARLDELGISPHRGRALLEQHPDSQEGSALDDAKDFLRTELAVGPRPVKEIKAAANTAGIAEKTLRRAKDELGVKAAKSDFHGGWTWALPTPAEDSQAAWPPSQRVGVGHLRRKSDGEPGSGLSVAAAEAEDGQPHHVAIFDAEAEREWLVTAPMDEVREYLADAQPAGDS